ncbi:uncharacterized protein N7515_004846 [Penicillium bovifimosum]|uniref:Uncharacterized protein n=1 Tax=Penicillium bovifimosum TaxID=126998 RepID=A0A9W9H1A0_9EURO|nr:uncharacterized protein N7515_004846 [Penicillium bovifimosum]KAJ5135568.1 hypothetical protein N7515_004846 [Penicillium bovifimosum]
MNQFQLFPPPSPEVKRNNNPFRKAAKKPVATAEPPSPIPLVEINDPGKTESVLLQIIEDTKPVPPPPPSTKDISRSKSPPMVVGTSHDARPPRSMHSQNRQAKRAEQQALPSHGSQSSSSSSSNHTTSATVSPQSSQSSTASVPIRSMFPQFDPNLPFNQQVFQPQVPAVPRSTKSTRKPPPKLTLSTNTDIDHVLGPKTVPASVLNFPTGDSEYEEVRYSSAEELKMLWETANGQRPEDVAGTLNLRMSKTGPATFTLGNPQNPFYTLQTYSTNELALSRRDPSNANYDVPIMMMSLEDRIRREHPNDGLVTLIFSRLAAMLAIDQASEISRQHHLSPAESAEIETDALKRAAAQESCRLSWNRHQRLYELRHPYFSKHHPPALIGAAGIPLSPTRPQSSGVVHITVSAPSSDASPRQPPTIIVTGPLSSTALEAAQQAADPRTSVLPVTDLDEPLASLDFGTRTLSISPAAVVATIPSLYAIDSLVAAMLAVAVSDEATNPILADMVIGSPKSSRPTTSQNSGQYSMPVFQGKLVTTVAEREDTEASMRLASQIKSAQKKSKDASQKKSAFKFWGRNVSAPREGSRSSKKNKGQNGIEEFDLEKYGRYGNGSSREGEKLPGITRSILRILFFGLDLVVKGLTLLVRILAWVLVNSTRCVTSEKF